MAFSTIPDSFKNGIRKWCNTRVKKEHGRKIKKSKFDAGKAQLTYVKIIEKINEIINEIQDNYKTESQIRSIITSYNYATQSDLTSHENETWTNPAGSQMPIHQGATTTSDRRLKYDVNIVGKSPSGLNIYTFRFKESVGYGNDLYQGVMSDEVPKTIVSKDKKGYDLVDYNKIDVNFVRVNNL